MGPHCQDQRGETSTARRMTFYLSTEVSLRPWEFRAMLSRRVFDSFQIYRLTELEDNGGTGPLRARDRLAEARTKNCRQWPRRDQIIGLNIFGRGGLVNAAAPATTWSARWRSNLHIIISLVSLTKILTKILTVPRACSTSRSEVPLSGRKVIETFRSCPTLPQSMSPHSQY